MEPSRTAALIKRLKERTFAALAASDIPPIDISTIEKADVELDLSDTPTTTNEPEAAD